VTVNGHRVEVGPMFKAPPVINVVVHSEVGVGVGTSFLTTVATGVVTVIVSNSVAQPVWQVGQMGIMDVGVAVQQGSLGGT